MKRDTTRRVVHRGPPSEAAVVAVINERPDVGPWEQTFCGQAERLARGSRWPAAKTNAGQDHWKAVDRDGVPALGGNLPGLTFIGSGDVVSEEKHIADSTG